MTRKEEIEKEAMLRFDSDDINCAITAFIAGAEYADRTMLKRVKAYLENHIDQDLIIYHENTWKRRDKFIEGLIKTLEG